MNMEQSLDKEKTLTLVLWLSKTSISKTKLERLLFFIDFGYAARNSGEDHHTITGLTYRKVFNGPNIEGLEGVIEYALRKNYLVCNVKNYQDGNFEFVYLVNNSAGEHIEELVDHSYKSTFSDAEQFSTETANQLLRGYKTSYLSELSHHYESWLSADYGTILIPTNVM